MSTKKMSRKVDRALQYPSNSRSNSIKTCRPFTICKEKKDITDGICMRLQRLRIEMSNRRGSLNSFRLVSGLNIPREKRR